MMAVEQKTKIRPVMNLSAPKGGAFNDAVLPEKLRKLEMSSANLVGHEILQAGRGAEIANLTFKMHSS